jgi:hypothetical protein
MYYHAQANGKIVETKDRIESESKIDWELETDSTFVIINCPDTDIAKDCWQYFKKSMLKDQLSKLLE